MSQFDRDYYEDGVRKGVSGYEGYKWLPTRSLSEAISITEKINFNSVIDYGCAKGFMVHALSLLGKHAKGVDISEYAVTNCMPQVKNKLHLIRNVSDMQSLEKVDLVIAKDVLEHLDEKAIEIALKVFGVMCDTVFIVVPLGDGNGRFRIREYEIDKTHVTREDEEWWINKITQAGFALRSFNYHFGDVKSNWKEHKYGNGFFVADRK